MKNHELIAKVGGIEKAREIVGGAPDGSEMAYMSTVDLVPTYLKFIDGDFWFHWLMGWGFACQKTYRDIESRGRIFKLDDLRTAIAEHDAPKFKVGDAIVYIDSFMHDEIGIVSKVDDRVWFNRGAAVCEFDMVRHATLDEKNAGHRELLGNSEQLDDVVDFGYHVSPLTKVSCHHQWINQDYLGCTEHHFICAYCSEKKTEAFGSCDHDWEDVTKPEQTERHLVCTYCDETKIQDMAIDAERWGES